MTSVLDLASWPAVTQRLVLRRFAPDDVPEIFAYRSRPDVAEWITSTSVDVESLADRFGDGGTAVIVERDGQVIGDLLVTIKDAYGQREVATSAAATEAELGWTFDPAQHGQGLATEAVRELIRICFDELGVRRVLAACFTANEPSWRLMERLGMRREAHHVSDSLHRDRGWQDEYVYALLADEWR
ncbi:GNAT family N-acetyltransferase [Aeromicrobium sp. SMF47]|uniref:GNAT family N-acetyltransferase n=1 Tax=Aeromicrobium yanjiei TaxID=2662028 RepID=A0A5Q2MM88_9ACTN|nr:MULTISPECIES: GNAT family protein [Aeromicrobium]MRJ75738.1 GNAT family N-acetyltransferase [Aeromicrobium yanjiei]MRK00082.1 GNAT family N-acetyltransferase [Aeromicrobium sp. S22]QGG43011.1 GNAT family N-acetyltransferase [Aeromicrobium yanjiei]